MAVGATVFLLGLHAFALHPILNILIAAPFGVKLAATVFLAGPVAFFMGFPFPLGLRQVSALAPGWLPWAWGVNGFGSVVGTLGAAVIAVPLGLIVPLASAGFLYALAGAIFWRTVEPLSNG